MFVQTVSAALEEEKKAQSMANWWYKTPEIHHEMLLHWKQAMLIWEAAEMFPEQVQRCRQMMLLHDGESGDSDDNDEVKQPVLPPNITSHNTSFRGEEPGEHEEEEMQPGLERQRFEENYQYLLREAHRLRAKQEYRVQRKRRHQQQQHHFRRTDTDNEEKSCHQEGEDKVMPRMPYNVMDYFDLMNSK